MCIAIVQKPDTQDLDWGTFKRLDKKHPDGMGMAWVEDGTIYTYKILERVDLFYEKYERARHYTESSLLIHFRKATHGDVSTENCHPFFVNEDLAFVHNGVIKMSDMPDDEVDTVVFRDRILRDFLPENWMEDADVVNMVAAFINHSKLAFLRSNGETFILNEKKGTWEDGIWYSNYTFRETIRVGYNRADQHPDNCDCYWCTRDSKWESYYSSKKKEQTDDDDDGVSVPVRVNTKEEARKEIEKLEREVQESNKSDDDPFLNSGYLFMGMAFCDVCLPNDLVEHEDCFNIDEYYEIVEGMSLFVCEDCGHTIYPSRSSIREKDNKRIKGAN